MLGLRLDEPLPLPEVAAAVHPAALTRLTPLGLTAKRGDGLVLTSRGRFLGGAVTAELLA